MASSRTAYETLEAVLFYTCEYPIRLILYPLEICAAKIGEKDFKNLNKNIPLQP